MLDVTAFVGAYPFRRVPGTSVPGLIEAMARTGIEEAWVSHLPSIFWRDPMTGNDWLLRAVGDHPQLRAVPAIHPGLPAWKRELSAMVRAGVPAVRADPPWYGLDPAGPAMRELVVACARAGVPLMSAVRLEDARQQHPLDRSAALPASAIRAWLRADAQVRLIVSHADRHLIEEVHFGSTPEESARIWWDINWIWGPPEDHLTTLLKTVGVDRFVFGTGQPLRLPEAAIAKLDLTDVTPDDRQAITRRNALAAIG